MKKSPKILLIDDDADNLWTLVEILTAQLPFADLLQTTNAHKAEQIARAEVPDLIVTDWQMPQLSGLELLRRLQGSPLTRDIPVIICTGKMIDSQYLKLALESGAYDYVRKPVDRIELVARITSGFQLAKSRQRVATQLLQLEAQKQEIAEEKAKREALLMDRIHLQEKDIEQLALYVTRQREASEALITKLEEKAAEARASDKSKFIQKLRNDLESQLYARKKMDRLVENIAEINERFFDTLTDHYGKLSSGERELCAYLRIGLNTKEIAILRGLAGESVKKSKHRLRKKLDIHPDEDIYQVLQNL